LHHGATVLTDAPREDQPIADPNGAAHANLHVSLENILGLPPSLLLNVGDALLRGRLIALSSLLEIRNFGRVGQTLADWF
jgi:hypothetical protein